MTPRIGDYAQDVKRFTVVIGCERCGIALAIKRWVERRLRMPVRSRRLGLCVECAEIGGEG